MGPTIFNVVCVKLRTMYIIYLLCSSLSELHHLIAQKIEKKKTQSDHYQQKQNETSWHCKELVKLK